MRRPLLGVIAAFALVSVAWGQSISPPPGGGSSATGANPSATIGTAAVNGSATTFMRSDAAPAIQKGTSSVFGVVKADGTTITSAAGVLSGAAAVAGANPSVSITGPVANGSAATFMRSDAVPALGTLTVPLLSTTNGALSAPAFKFSGTRITGGSGSTTQPYFLLQESTATAGSTWDTVGGTVFGINMHTAAGYFVDWQQDNSSKFSVSSIGSVFASGNLNGNHIIAASNSCWQFSGRSIACSPADGRFRLTGNSGSIGIAVDVTGAPTVTGTGSPTVTAGSTDTAGEITTGTSSTTDTITWAQVKTNAPFCTVTSQTALATALAYTISTTTLVITTPATTGDKINWVCFGRPN